MKNALPTIIKLFAVFSIIYWVFIFATDAEMILFDLFGVMLIILPILGIIYACNVKKEWGGFKSSVGKSITFITISLLAWAIGQAIFVYYAISAGEVPYPGAPDLFFILMDPFYALAMIMIMKYSGASRNIGRKSYAPLILLTVPLALLAFNYWFFFGTEFVFGDLPDPELIFNLIYSFGSTLVMTLIVITVVLSYGKLGGKMKSALYIIFAGILLQYVGDILYSLIELESDAWNGTPGDFLFFLSLTTVIIGLTKLDTKVLIGEPTEEHKDE
jgi:hypothetical protein